MLGTLSFLQRPHGETHGLKDLITILRAGTAHRGRDREKRQDCSSNFPGHIVPQKTHMEINEKQNDQILKWSHLDSRKQNWCYYCWLVLSFEIRESETQMLGSGPSRMLHPAV